MAADMTEAMQMLRREGKIILDLQEEREGAPASSEDTSGAVRIGGRVRRDDIIYFSTQLAIMVDTGVPLSEALTDIAKQSENPAMDVLIRDISEQVNSGIEFSRALERHSK